uniref:Neprosin domain-containing protein n=1 Tax=Physcomitrium patens TaxID=3218 RepID=A0A2K1L825_PHYPA|nr:hypothetical protein PHYPA_000614 [Physcomitrium patens]
MSGPQPPEFMKKIVPLKLMKLLQLIHLFMSMLSVDSFVHEYAVTNNQLFPVDSFVHEYAVTNIPVIPVIPGAYGGTAAVFSVNAPTVANSTEMSLSQLWVTHASYDDKSLCTVKVGWQTYPYMHTGSGEFPTVHYPLPACVTNITYANAVSEVTNLDANFTSLTELAFQTDLSHHDALITSNENGISSSGGAACTPSIVLVLPQLDLAS